MRRKLWLLSIVSLIILGTYITKTYALFESNLVGGVNNPIGKWNIKLNDILVSSLEEKVITIDNFIYDDNENVKDGYIAPGSRGYFDLILDTTGTEVAVKYNIVIDLDKIENENIILSVVSLNDVAVANTERGIYSGILSLEDITNNSQIILRLTINWNNDISYDSTDTELGIKLDSKLEVPIKINVEQYLGE